MVVEGNTNLTFVEHNISSECEGALHACTIDIDLDGDIDIVTSASEIDTITLWENSGDNFTEYVIDDSFDEVLHIQVVDLDLDGDIDILGGAQKGNELAWWENDDMTFTKYIVASDIVAAHSLYSGDVDQDGDLDLFSTSDDDISWWENDGQQSFTKYTLLQRTSSPSQGFIRYIYALDLDNDTDIDFISGDNIWGATTADTIYYWLNNGSQTFTQKTVEGISYTQFHGFDVVDLDKDGDIDLCTASPDKKQLDWFENDGQLNFTQHTVTNTFNGANDVHPGDIDDDGDLDLIAAAYHDDKISWFENDGDQVFTEHVINKNFDGAHYCMISDINKDGLNDVLGLAWEGDEVIWWEQTMSEFTTTTTTTDTTTTSTTTTSSLSTSRFGIVIVICTIILSKFKKRE